MNKVMEGEPVTMTPGERDEWLEAFRQTDAIFALESFELTGQRKKIREAVLAGRVTHAQAGEELREYAIKNKTTKGFIENRDWA